MAAEYRLLINVTANFTHVDLREILVQCMDNQYTMVSEDVSEGKIRVKIYAPIKAE